MFLFSPNLFTDSEDCGEWILRQLVWSNKKSCTNRHQHNKFTDPVDPGHKNCLCDSVLCELDECLMFDFGGHERRVRYSILGLMSYSTLKRSQFSEVYERIPYMKFSVKAGPVQDYTLLVLCPPGPWAVHQYSNAISKMASDSAPKSRIRNKFTSTLQCCN